MNIFICDDDNLVCEQIKALCENYYIEHKLKRPDIYIFHSGEDILASDIKPDIVYLDIQMSGIDGIAVATITPMIHIAPEAGQISFVPKFAKLDIVNKANANIASGQPTALIMR